MESILLDTMYDLPSMDNVEKVVLDEAVIKGEAKPLIMYSSDKAPRTAAADD